MRREFWSLPRQLICAAASTGMKKDLLGLQATVAFQAIQAQILYSMFRDVLSDGGRNESAAQNFDRVYRDTLKAQTGKFLAALSDDRPAFATELHNLLKRHLDE